MEKKKNIVPDTHEERTRLRKLVQSFAEGKKLVPPVGLSMLETLADELSCVHHLAPELKEWLMVELHNSMWMPRLAAIPYERRLLLLPQCLKHSGQCRAEIDDIGLLCHKCGRCSIPQMEDRAAELCVLSMVAEGFTTVIELIENRVVDAVIGVSCVDSLEKAFPLLVNNAVPGVAIVLNRDGCVDTTVDEDYVRQMIEMRTETTQGVMNFGDTREEVNGWFAALCNKAALDATDARSVAMHWLGSNGKRWRPFLVASVYKALTGITDTPQEVKDAAIAVECFHKASLVHDDIQDRDMVRYGAPTVNAIYGDAIAINIGDMLLGEGYRLLASCQHRQLLAAVSQAHINLCEGQGAELAWTHSPTPLTLRFVLDIFAHKTVPAFSVALQMGAICADVKDGRLMSLLNEYSEAIGIAYQLNDDLDDYVEDNEMAHRPSVVLALMTEHADWTKQQVVDAVKEMIAHYRNKAQDIVEKIDNFELKRLLMLVSGKIVK